MLRGVAAKLAPALLALCAVSAIVGPLMEGRERAAEAAIRGYLAAIETGNAELALGFLAPERRDDWRIYVQHQAGDHFGLLSVAVRRVPLWQDPSGWARTRSVTIVAEARGKGGETWQAADLVHGRYDGDAWLLTAPPFGPPEPWLVPPGP